MKFLLLSLVLSHPAHHDTMTHAQAERQAREWYVPAGGPPYAWRCGGRCKVGPYSDPYGEGRTWEEAFKDAEKRGYCPAKGYDAWRDREVRSWQEP